MKTNRKFLKVLPLMIHIAMVVGVILALVGPAYAAPVISEVEVNAGSAQSAKASSLLQFTSGGHALGFTTQGMYAATGSHGLRVDFVNANNVQPQADSPASPSTLRQAQDDASLRTGADGKAVPLSRVVYADLWEGITLTYATRAGSIFTTIYDLAPGADAKNIRLRYNAPLTLSPNGTLNIAFETGMLTESAPIAWQNINGKRVSVEVRFSLSLPERGAGDEGQTVTFALGRYDPRHALTIDPSLFWNTFLGGSEDDRGRAIAVDGSGNIYVAGNSNATWGSPVRTYHSDRDGFAAKLDSSGNLLWNTFLGGNGTDAANGIAVDGSGNIYLVGDSDAAWTCLDLFQCTVAPYFTDVDAFVAKLDSSGHLDWNTFMIGVSGRTEYGTAIAVDTNSNPNVIYIAGDTDKTFYFDAFVAKLDLSGNANWFAFLGADLENDFANAIAVDGSGNVYVAGDSDAAWGCSPTPCTVRAYHSGVDVFAAKLDSSDNLLWNTFLGGDGTDHGYGIAVDGSGNVYVAGDSDAAWTCLDLFQCTVQDYTGATDAFAAKLDSSGHLDWNTFLGGSYDDFGRGIAFGSGNVYVAGYSDASWGGSLGLWDAFDAKLTSSGALVWNTFLGGLGYEFGSTITVDGSGNTYVAGYGDDWGRPVRPHSTNSSYDAFVAKVDFLFRTYLPLIEKR